MSEINYERINDYLDGQLSGEDLLAFEKEMQLNAELAREVALFKTTGNQLSAQLKNLEEKEKLAETLKGFNTTYFKKPEVIVRSFGRWWYAAAVAAAIILFFIIRPFQHQALSNEALFTAYNKNVEELPGAERGSQNDTVLQRATALYNKKDYASVLPLLQNVLAAKPGEIQLYLATGICYLQTGKYDSAINVFDTIANGNTVFKTEAIWYRALALLKQNKLADCRNALQSIPRGGYQFEEAAALLKEIEGR